LGTKMKVIFFLWS